MEKFFKELCSDLWQNSRGRTIGLIAGFVLSVAILCFGVFKTFFVIIISGMGYYIGSKMDKDGEWEQFLEKVQDDLLRLLPDRFRHW